MSNKEFFLRIAAAVSAGDVEHILEWFSEDFTLHEPGVQLLTGHEGARLMLHHLRTVVVPEARLEVLDMVEEGDRVAVRWQFSGVKDDHPVVVPCIAIYRFVDGRIAEDWDIASYPSGNRSHDFQAEHGGTALAVRAYSDQF